MEEANHTESELSSDGLKTDTFLQILSWILFSFSLCSLQYLDTTRRVHITYTRIISMRLITILAGLSISFGLGIKFAIIYYLIYYNFQKIETIVNRKHKGMAVTREIAFVRNCEIKEEDYDM